MAAFICCRCNYSWKETIGVDAEQTDAIDRCPKPGKPVCPGVTYLQIEPDDKLGRRWFKGQFPWTPSNLSFIDSDVDAFRQILGSHLPRPKSDLLDFLRRKNLPAESALATTPVNRASASRPAAAAAAATNATAAQTPPPVTAAASQPVPVDPEVLSRRENRIWERGNNRTHCDVDGLEKTKSMIGVVRESSAWFIYQVRDGDRGICMRCEQPFQEAIGCCGDNGDCRRAICVNCAPSAITNRHFMPLTHCCLVPPDATIPAGKEVERGSR